MRIFLQKSDRHLVFYKQTICQIMRSIKKCKVLVSKRDFLQYPSVCYFYFFHRINLICRIFKIKHYSLYKDVTTEMQFFFLRSLYIFICPKKLSFTRAFLPAIPGLQKKKPLLSRKIKEAFQFGAANRGRTGTVLPPRDFKSLASAYSAIAAQNYLTSLSHAGKKSNL